MKKTKSSVPNINPFGGIQVNTCMNFQCPNYKVNTQPFLRKNVDKYKMVCKICESSISVYSNKSIYKTYQEIFGYRYLRDKDIKHNSCNNVKCINKDKSIEIYPNKYKKNGFTAKGSQIYKCKTCGKTFSKRAHHSQHQYHRKTHKDKMIFHSIIHGLGIRKNAYLNEVSTKTIYQKLDYFYEQCLRFNHLFDEKIKKKKLYTKRISVDAITLTTNWRTNPAKSHKYISPLKPVGGGVKLNMLTSVDNETQFVYAQTLAFDSSVKADEINEWARKSGELNKNYLLREHPHYKYYDEAKPGDRYLNYLNGQNFRKIDTFGIAIDETYHVYAHFHYLVNLFNNSKRVVFYLDAFPRVEIPVSRIFNNKKTKDKFYIYTLSIGHKPTSSYPSKSRENFIKAYKEFVKNKEGFCKMIDQSDRDTWLKKIKEIEYEIGKLLIQERVELESFDQHLSPIEHPLPKGREPSKAVKLTSDHLSNLSKQKHYVNDIQMAVLNGVDNYFQNLRSMAFFKRSTKQLQDDKNATSEWKIDKAYDPLKVIKMAELYKTYYNFIKVGTDNKTPAQRMGLTKRKWTINDILTKKY